MSSNKDAAKKIIDHILQSMIAILESGTSFYELPQEQKKGVVSSWVNYAESVITDHCKKPEKYLKAYFDGSASPNPGPMSCGYAVNSAIGEPLMGERKNLTFGTNNKAEYLGLINLLKAIKTRQDWGEYKIKIHGDSQLVIKQMNGEWKVKDPYIKKLYEQAQSLMEPNYELIWIPRNQNTEADRLSKRQ